MVHLFNRTIKNTLHFIPHEIITCDDRDPPSINPSRHTTSFQRLYDVYTTSATSYRRRINVETTSCVYWDSSIRRLIQDKNEAYKRFKRSNNNSQYFENFQSLQNLLGVSTEASKERCYSRLSKKLMESSTIPKNISQY